MALRVKFKSQCYYCKFWVLPNSGYLQRVNGKWYAHCDKCYKEKKDKENGPITLKPN